MMPQFGSGQGFYGQANYSAHQASYRHRQRYVYTSSDAEVHHHDAGGQYFHLLLVNVLRGIPLKTTDVWQGAGFGALQDKLGQQFESVEGGPHQPILSGPYAAKVRGSDDSVTYHASQCLPEFIVTHRTNMHPKRGKGMVELIFYYAWHGSGTTQPDSIAAGSG